MTRGEWTEPLIAHGGQLTIERFETDLPGRLDAGTTLRQGNLRRAHARHRTQGFSNFFDTRLAVHPLDSVLTLHGSPPFGYDWAPRGSASRVPPAAEGKLPHQHRRLETKAAKRSRRDQLSDKLGLLLGHQLLDQFRQ